MGLLDKFKKITKKEDKAPVKKVVAKDIKEKAPAGLKLKEDSQAPVSGKEKEIKAKKGKKEDTQNAYKVLVKPLITEKATYLASLGKYCFAVSKDSNKIEIKKAIKALYGVEAKDINIINQKGKRVTYGRVRGKTKSWKKAIITLKPGDKIELYEGV